MIRRRHLMAAKSRSRAATRRRARSGVSRSSIFGAHGLVIANLRSRADSNGSTAANALIYTGPAADAVHAPGLVLLDRRDATHRVLTSPEIAEGAHVDPRLSSDGANLAYASRREGEAQLWETDWPALKQRTALLARPEPVYGHAFEPDRDALWVAGDLTLYRALNRVRAGRDPELIGGRGATSIDLARDGTASGPKRTTTPISGFARTTARGPRLRVRPVTNRSRNSRRTARASRS